MTAIENAPALELRDFSFCFPQGDDILSQVNWVVQPGTFTLLVGATGSGKTTLLRSIKPQTAPTGQHEGWVSVFGVDALGMPEADSASLVGYVAQSPDNQSVCHTVWHEMAFGLENLGVPPQEMRRRVAEVAHFFGMEPWFQSEMDCLSGGQKQLVNLASILVMQPKLLLLDEPTSQLDPVAQRNFCHALYRLNRELGLTLVVATHSPQLFESYATHCVQLEGKTVVPLQKDVFRERPLEMGEIPTPNAAVENAKDAIILKDVYVRYGRQGDFILRGLDLNVKQGSIHGLVGGIGSGKTTLLKAIGSTLKASRGKLWNGLRSQQAFLPQDPKALFVCDTVLEELQEWSAGCGYGQPEIDEWLERIGLAGRQQQHPYDLSGGQQQLLAFAKLALTRPGLLLLDEPAKGLDTSSKVQLAQQLKSCARQGVTVVMATHDLAFAACVADRVSMLFDGQVTCTESPREFFSSNVFYRPMKDAFSEMMLSGEGKEAVG